MSEHKGSGNEERTPMHNAPDRVERKRWLGDLRPEDDFGAQIKDVFIDGATVHGPWAIMTPASHAKYGRGLGMGRGQKYQREDDGVFYKVAG